MADDWAVDISRQASLEDLRDSIALVAAGLCATGIMLVVLVVLYTATVFHSDLTPLQILTEPDSPGADHVMSTD
ncbi:hypothetical protein [Palleronia caenipelagi]|uniref:Uncharacterized protein n=1 Tax=Palleronia caenipelagi TaxID=2489174 RepID=A0A547Q682_9RHOB|nr:hypothetical protein [Palleronia caenipelagi]TRD21883.1 hypothetical protein FEV53_07490 [Palleronia caenipelagi]